MKLDSAGNVTWQKTYVGSGSQQVRSIQQTTEGGYVVGGSTSSSGAGAADAWIIKLDSNGNITWQKTYGGSSGDTLYSIQETTDGDYVAAGDTGSFGAGGKDAWIIKLDSTGNVTWQKTYGESNWEVMFSIQETTNGGYVAAGLTANLDIFKSDVFVLSLDSNGAIPTCDIIQTSDAAITNPSITSENTSVTATPFSAIVVPITIIPQDSSASITTVCPTDLDNDGILDDGDGSGTPDDNPCTGGQTENCDDNCPNHFNPLQEDTYPPQGNGIGDACDCECDFDCDGDVDADDVGPFLVDFGRFEFNNPCTNADPCNGDTDCDGNVDADDVAEFLADFGRFQFNNPCPSCVAGDWCVYP